MIDDIDIFEHMASNSFYILSAFTLAIHFHLIAQPANFTISDGTKPLPYTSVVNLRTGLGMFASEKGEVELNPSLFLAGDTLRISYTGYADTLIKVPFSGNQIELRAVSIPLQDIEIYPCLNSKIVTLKNYKKHKKNQSFGMGGSWAAYVPNSEIIMGFIESITIEQSYFTVPAHARKAPFKVRLFHYDPVKGLPGKPLAAKEWMVYPSNKATVIQIGDENLRLPQEGLVICVDYFYSGEKYAYKRKVSSLNADGTRTNEWQRHFGASFRGVRGENLVGKGFMSIKSNSWMELTGYGYEDRAIMVKLGIKQCN